MVRGSKKTEVLYLREITLRATATSERIPHSREETLAVTLDQASSTMEADSKMDQDSKKEVDSTTMEPDSLKDKDSKKEADHLSTEMEVQDCKAMATPQELLAV